MFNTFHNNLLQSSYREYALSLKKKRDAKNEP